jgi:hypothetical protein
MKGQEERGGEGWKERERKKMVGNSGAGKENSGIEQVKGMRKVKKMNEIE